MNPFTLEGQQILALPLTILLGVGFVGAWLMRHRSGEVRNQWCRVVVVGMLLLLTGPLFPFKYPVLPTAKTVLTLTPEQYAYLMSLPREREFPWMSLYWAGAGLVLLASIIGFGRAAYLRRTATKLPTGNSSLDIRMSEAIRVPMAVGVFEHTILVPEGATEKPDFGTVLLHEAAHIRRRDTRWLVPMAIVQVLFWYHPLVWLWAWQLRTTAEHAADDWVIRQGVQPVDYAKQLLAYAKTLSAEPGLWASSPFARTGRMADRLRRILNPLTEKTMITKRQSLSLLAGAICMTGGLCAISFAQTKPATAKKSTKKVVRDYAEARAPIAPASYASSPAAPAAPIAPHDAPEVRIDGPAIQDDIAPAISEERFPVGKTLEQATAIAPAAPAAPAAPGVQTGPARAVQGRQVVIVDGVVYEVRKDKKGKPVLVKIAKGTRAVEGFPAPARALEERERRAVAEAMKQEQAAIREAQRAMASGRADAQRGFREARIEMERALAAARKNGARDAHGRRLTEAQIREIETSARGALKAVEGTLLSPEFTEKALKRSMAIQVPGFPIDPKQFEGMKIDPKKLRQLMEVEGFKLDPKAFKEMAQIEGFKLDPKAMQEMAKFRDLRGIEVPIMHDLFVPSRAIAGRALSTTRSGNSDLRAELAKLRAELDQLKKELKNKKAPAKKPTKPAKEEGSIGEGESVGLTTAGSFGG